MSNQPAAAISEKGTARWINPTTLIVFYLSLAAILGFFTFRYIPKDTEYKAIVAVGGMGITLLLGLMAQSLTVFNAREQVRATRENLSKQIESTEQLAEAQREHTLALAGVQSAHNKELEFLRATYALLQQQYKMEIERDREREKDYATIRLNYLDPLRVAANDLALRMEEIQKKLTFEKELADDHTDSIQMMARRFHFVKHPESATLLDHLYWSNGEGYFAMSSNYRTVLYFFFANKTRREFPFGVLREGDDSKLIDALDDVRNTIGDYWGIFQTLQDSAGEYARRDDGHAIGYIEFCRRMYDEEERAQIVKVIDFYREIHKKRDRERDDMIASLKNLTNVVKIVARLKS